MSNNFDPDQSAALGHHVGCFMRFAFFFAFLGSSWLLLFNFDCLSLQLTVVVSHVELLWWSSSMLHDPHLFVGLGSITVLFIHIRIFYIPYWFTAAQSNLHWFCAWGHQCPGSGAVPTCDAECHGGLSRNPKGTFTFARQGCFKIWSEMKWIQVVIANETWRKKTGCPDFGGAMLHSCAICNFASCMFFAPWAAHLIPICSNCSSAILCHTAWCSFYHNLI